MNDSVAPSLEDRVLVLAPTAKDSELSRTLLAEAGMACTPCTSLADVCREIEAGASTALLPEEALGNNGIERLATTLSRQQPWSDFPLLVLAREGANSAVALRILEALGNVTLLERPLRVATLVSAVRTALRARQRQYQIRAHLEASRRVAEVLRTADRQKDEFLAMLGHELRNPLAPLLNALHVLKATSTPAALAHELHDMMERQVTHLVRLVDDLLDVSRILQGRIVLRIERLDLATVLARAVETARPLIDNQGHELTVALGPALLLVEGDMVRLAQVFANLLNNAAKYTEKAGHIWLSAERNGNEVVVRVRDDGIGIAPEMLPRVFDLFTQAERSLDRSQGGLGLGLTLVRRLVEMHHGSVQVSSAGVGRGSEFVVHLPALGESVDRPDETEADVPAVPTVPSRRVLVVDDNTDGAESLAMLLRMAGHKVVTAYTGPAALEAARTFRPQVAVLDIGLPGMNGYEVASHLRRTAGAEPLLLVAVTGYGQEGDRRRAREAGFDLHLTKPVDTDELMRVLAAGLVEV